MRTSPTAQAASLSRTWWHICPATSTTTAPSTPPTTSCGGRPTANGPTGYNTWRTNFGQPGRQRLQYRGERRRPRAVDAGDASSGGCGRVFTSTPGRIESPENSSTRETGQQPPLLDLNIAFRFRKTTRSETVRRGHSGILTTLDEPPFRFTTAMGFRKCLPSTYDIFKRTEHWKHWNEA